LFSWDTRLGFTVTAELDLSILESTGANVEWLQATAWEGMITHAEAQGELNMHARGIKIEQARILVRDYSIEPNLWTQLTTEQADQALAELALAFTTISTSSEFVWRNELQH
jgi:hypothetical protein